MFFGGTRCIYVSGGGGTEPSTRRISDHSKLRLVGECDDVHIARSSTHKNVRRRRKESWQRSSMSLTSAAHAWFPVSGHDLLQTAGLRSCSAIARRTDPVLALRTREVQCRSASSWPSARHYTAFAVHRENVCLPPIHCRKWPLVISYYPCVSRPNFIET